MDAFGSDGGSMTFDNFEANGMHSVTPVFKVGVGYVYTDAHVTQTGIRDVSRADLSVSSGEDVSVWVARLRRASPLQQAPSCKSPLRVGGWLRGFFQNIIKPQY
jgi:hypothetical protein